MNIALGIAVVILIIAVVILFARLDGQADQMIKCLEFVKQVGGNQKALDQRQDLMSQRLDLQTQTIQITISGLI